MFSKENLQGNFIADIYNNTIVDCNGAIYTTSDPSDFGMGINFYENIYSSDRTDNVIALGRWSSNIFDISHWKASNNIYEHPGSSQFFIHQGTPYAFLDAMIQFGETSSVSDTPGFIDHSTLDVRLSENSIARDFGVDGVDLGALPYGSEYIVNINNQKRNQ